MLRTLLIIAATLLASPAWSASPKDVALVTALEGKVHRIVGNVREPVQAFVKLKQDDLLVLEGVGKLHVVFFESRRQEMWSGSGRLEIGHEQGRPFGLKEPQVKTLPEILVKQIAKTPALDSQGRAGVVRLRAIPTPEALAKLDNDYKRLRMEANPGDLEPEMFLLAGLLEMQQIERLESALSDLQMSHSTKPEAKLLAALYRKSLNNLRISR